MAEAHTTTDAAACSTEYFSARVESLREALSTMDVNEDEARVDAEIEASKAHWSELRSAHVTAVEVQAVESSSTSTSEPSSSELKGMSEVETMGERNERVAKDNVEVFRSLQARYPGGFFIDDNDVGFDHIHRLPRFLVDEDGKPKAMEVKLSSEKPFAEGVRSTLSCSSGFPWPCEREGIGYEGVQGGNILERPAKAVVTFHAQRQAYTR